MDLLEVPTYTRHHGGEGDDFTWAAYQKTVVLAPKE